MLVENWEKLCQKVWFRGVGYSWRELRVKQRGWSGKRNKGSHLG